MRLRQTRSLAECSKELAAAPSGLLAVELTSTNLLGVLRVVVESGRRFPLCAHDRAGRAVDGGARVVAARSGSGAPGYLAGAGRFWSAIAERHFSAAAPPATTLAAEIWDRLPWGDAGTNAITTKEATTNDDANNRGSE